MKIIHRLLFATCLLSSASLALAAPSPRDHDKQDHHGHDRGHDRDHGDGHDRGRHDQGRYDGRDHDRGYGDRDGGRRHYAHRHWERGHRYYGPDYVVRDYRHYRLRPPPRGYRWVRDDNNDYLLVAVATGIILDIATH
ncbi:MAG TPA: RcnB family protein [Rhodanobacter sp.]|nr:RcnB family protein [Rhodanobacter sp.]